MGILDIYNDFYNGFTNKLKREYSPFLSAALIYFSNFKIEDLRVSFQGATLSKKDDEFRLELTLHRRNGKVNELNTRIFSYLSGDLFIKINKIKPVNEHLTFYEYKNIRNISSESNLNISKVMGNDWLYVQYMQDKSIRSYINYLNSVNHKSNIESLCNILEKYKSGIDKYQLNKIDNEIMNIESIQKKYRFGFSKQKVDAEFILDSKFKKVDVIDRLKAIGQSASIGYDLSEFESYNEYKYMDNWILRLKSKLKNNVIFDEAILIGGLDSRGYKLIEDDYLFISEGINIIFENWMSFKRNY